MPNGGKLTGEKWAYCRTCQYVSDLIDAFTFCDCGRLLWPRLMYECPVCGYLFTSRRGLREHDCHEPEA